MGLLARNLNAELEPIGFHHESSSVHKEHPADELSVPSTAPSTRARSHSYHRDLAQNFDSALDLEQSLQDLNSKRLLNSFFTITTACQEPPVYVSEIAHDVANPQFKKLDLSSLGLKSGRNENKFVLTVWAKSATDSSYNRIICEYVNLPDLQFIGRSRYPIYSNFPQNSLILNLIDGYYLLPHTFSVTAPYSDPTNTPSDTLYMGLYSHTKNLSTSESFYDSAPQYTSSFNSIMKLSNLQACIVDAENTKNDAATHISALLNKKPVLFALRKQRQQQQHKLLLTKQRLAEEQSRIAALTFKVQQTKAAMQARKDYITRQLAKQRVARRESAAMESSISTDKIVISDDRVQAQLQRARIVNDLNVIFPINPIPSLSFKFTICGVPLPDYSNQQPSGPQISRSIVKDFGVSEDDLIAASYGFAAQLLTLLSYYLGVPLRYPVQPYGSQSFIIDPISAIQGSRTFPLWTRGSLYFRFQYASFLFNKNIEQLMCSQAMGVADLKPTLANLKNLLLVLSTETRKEIV